MNRPNILLIMVDQFRGDCLGISGHPDVKTPNLDTLATNGVNFMKAYSACPTCIPARAALFTGMSQKKHGRVGYRDAVPWEYPHMLAGELTEAGYYTQAVGKMHVYPLRNNCGFHNVELHDGYLEHFRKPHLPYYEHQTVADDYFYWLKDQKGLMADVSDSGMECNSWMARPWQYEEELHPTNWVVSRSIDFLRKRDRTKPFFLFQSFVRPHSPFDAPPCYFDMYNQMELTPPPIGDWADDTHKTIGRIHNNNYMSPDPELVRQAQVGYYACITHLDHQIGRFMQALAEDNVLHNTFIVFVADHGELMGDHHLFRKSVPYEGSARIPLVIRPHSGFDVKRGTTRNNVAELRDIMPTLLDIAGAEIPETVDGISLCDVLKAEETTLTREYLHGEHTYDKRSNHYIVTERDKYIWFSQSGREQYFDLVNDPQELEDKINESDCSERINMLRKWLIAELDGRPEGYSDGKNLIVGRQYTPVLF